MRHSDQMSLSRGSWWLRWTRAVVDWWWRWSLEAVVVVVVEMEAEVVGMGGGGGGDGSVVVEGVVS